MAIELPWIEKYRPAKLEDVVGQKEIAERLQNYVKQHNCPNMLFSGTAGIGKTSAAVALAKELFGKEFERNFLELNASDTRGIDVVRGQIKDFARTLAFNADFKIIFLDESDALTTDAQQALRRTMEKYTKTCRFVLSCVAPDTRIVLPEEVETTIGEFMKKFEEKKQSQVITKNSDGGIEKDQAICCIQQNPKTLGKKVFELKTNTGRKVKATKDHRFLTNSGWKAVQDINLGDKLVVFPHLEGTLFEENNQPIIDLNAFKEFLLEKEAQKGYKKLGEAERFGELESKEKQKIIDKAKELLRIVQSNEGLTKRESIVLGIISKNRRISRQKIQEKIGLSRIRTAQLLKELEKKCFVKRIIQKKEHSFEAIEKQPIQIRNKMDIRNILEKEFGVKISYCGIKKHLERKTSFQGGFEGIIENLNEKGLLGLGYGFEKIGAFTRIFGFLYGDGHITKRRERLIFTGNQDALQEVKKDLAVLGFSGSEISTKQLNNIIRGRAFAGKTTSFYVDSNSLVKMLEFLGAPVGNKIVAPYKVPNWITNGTRFVKREFLRSLYGCEGYSPKIKNKNFASLSLRMHKSRHLKQNMIEFMEQIGELLKEFEVESYIKIRVLGNQRKDGHVTDEYGIILKSTNENMFRFFCRISYAYEKEKTNNARLAAEYLRFKLYCLKMQKQKASKIVCEKNSRLSKVAIAQRHGCSTDFVTNTFKGKEARLLRSFPSYESWKKETNAGNGFVFNEVVEIKETECTDVRDITCTKNHNFIANGIVSHNCNYSSKIIEPIQSRCVVFRFRPLPAKEIEERLLEIAKKEKIQVDEKALKAIVYVCMGDMRKAINVLQAAASIGGKVSEATVFDVSSRARPQEIKQMIELALNGKFLEARELLDKLMYEHGMSGEDVITQLYRETMAMDETELPSKKKIELVDIIGEYNFRLVEGANERIQLEALLAQFMKYGK